MVGIWLRCAGWVGALGVTLSTASAQVRSLTLGINVNSPYGITEPWMTIRDGLQRLEFVDWISPQPDRISATAELRTRDGQWPDLDVLAQALRDTGAGASLRGLEATIEGLLVREGDAFLVRIPGLKAAVHLKPLTGLIQHGQQATEAEKAAYRTLTTHWAGRPLSVKLVGPVHKGNDQAGNAGVAGRLTLEVRRFTITG